MRDNRPQVIAQKNFLLHKEQLQAASLESRFRYIFEHNLWSSTESRSGLGSTLTETELLRRELPVLLRSVGVQSLLDVPCGDFAWMQHLDLSGIAYTGADILSELITRNQQDFGSPSRRFLTLDLTRDDLPAADAVLCRDCLVHLSVPNIHRALANIAQSGARWLLTTNFPETITNVEIDDGDWRALNFEAPPFDFPPPEAILVEGCQEAGGAFADKSLALWRVEAIRKLPT